jgi:hypothetical protein
MTHDQVITKLQDASGNQVQLIIKHMNNMARYLHLTSTKLSSSLPKIPSAKTRRDHNRKSAEYPSEYYHQIKQQRFSLILSDEQKVRKAIVILGVSYSVDKTQLSNNFYLDMSGTILLISTSASVEW